MKANELMIGDWVLDGNHIAQVVLLTCDGIIGTTFNESSNIEVVEPILLTPEILKKNGFQYFHKNFCSLSYDHPFQLEMKQWPDENGLGGLWAICDIIEIRFVHQLQHALKLCGIEKEIEL